MAWTQQARLTAPDSAEYDNFGASVALSGDHALVGAWGKAGQIGAAYLYARNGTVWHEQAKLTSSDGAIGDLFGYSVALGGDTAVVGAYQKELAVGAVYVYANLQTTASLTISRHNGSPGTTLALAGSGFSPGETVHFAYRSINTVPLGIAAVNAGGAFTATVRFPLAPYGTGMIRAVGQSSGVFGAANFLVIPRLIMYPGAGTPGSSVVAQGFGFGAGETVNLAWLTPLLSVGTVTADGTGSFYQDRALTIIIPAGAPAGTNLVVAVGQTTQTTGKGYVNVQ